MFWKPLLGLDFKLTKVQPHLREPRHPVQLNSSLCTHHSLSTPLIPHSRVSSCIARVCSIRSSELARQSGCKLSPPMSHPRSKTSYFVCPFSSNWKFLTHARYLRFLSLLGHHVGVLQSGPGLFEAWPCLDRQQRVSASLQSHCARLCDRKLVGHVQAVHRRPDWLHRRWSARR